MSELSNGWAVTKLGYIGVWRTGGTPARRNSVFFGKGIPWVKSGDLSDGLITKTAEEITKAGLENSAAKLMPTGTISMALYGATIGKLGIMSFPAATNQACANIIPDSRIVEGKFVFYYLLSQRRSFIEQAQGGAQPNISQEIVRSHPIPIAPLAEQRRLVAKLQTLLDKVEACRKRLGKIPPLLKRFRQSVLAAACSGRLTVDWRKTNTPDSISNLLEEISRRRKMLWLEQRRLKGFPTKPEQYPTAASPTKEFQFDCPGTWQVCSMDALTSVITSGSRDWKQYYKKDGPGTFIMAQNVRPMRFDQSYRLAVAPPTDNRDRARSEALKNDLLVTIVGANTGDCCRISSDLREHYVCQSVALMRPVMSETAAFLELFLNSPSHGLAQYQKWIYGEGRPHLSFDHLRQTLICLPPLAEQREIVRRVQNLFKQADAIEVRFERAKAYVDQVTQSLLRKAFRGELVSQDPDDEPASVLLERIRSPRKNFTPEDYFAQLIPALLRAVSGPLSLEKLNATVALLFLPKILRPMVASVADSKMQTHFEKFNQPLKESAFQLMLRLLVKNEVIICEPNSGAPLLRLNEPAAPPTDVVVAEDARGLAAVMTLVPNESIQATVRKLCPKQLQKELTMTA